MTPMIFHSLNQTIKQIINHRLNCKVCFLCGFIVLPVKCPTRRVIKGIILHIIRWDQRISHFWCLFSVLTTILSEVVGMVLCFGDGFLGNQ